MVFVEKAPPSEKRSGVFPKGEVIFMPKLAPVEIPFVYTPVGLLP